MTRSAEDQPADHQPGGDGNTAPVAAGAGARTRWLTDEERKAWLASAAIMITLPAALDAQLQRDSDLTFVEYMVLAVLSERADRTMRMSDIAAGVSASPSRLSHVVGRLEKRGLVRRSRLPGPGRRTNATVTDDGYATVAAAAPAHVGAVRDYFVDALEPADLAMLQRIGAQVAARVNPARPFVHGTNT